MTEELYWLTLTTMMTGLFWMPYVLNRFAEAGILPAIMDPNADLGAKAMWANRMMRAHENAVENLVVFAALVLVLHVTGTGSALTASAAAVYFFARLAHFIVYALGIPALRTVAFLVGFGCQMIIGFTALGVLK